MQGGKATTKRGNEKQSGLRDPFLRWSPADAELAEDVLLGGAVNAGACQ